MVILGIPLSPSPSLTSLLSLVLCLSFQGLTKHALEAPTVWEQ